MMTKHFFKTLFLFTLMIGLGLAFVFVVNYFNEGTGTNVLNTDNLAK